MQRILRAVCLVGMWLIAVVAEAAVPCRVDGTGNLRVQLGDRVAEGPRVIADCAGLKALSDGVLACYVTTEGRPECARLASGETFEPAEASRRAQSVFRKIMRLVEGTREMAPGGLRAASGERRAGFPYGRVHLQDGALAIATQGTGYIDMFVLMPAGRQGAPVFQARNATAPLQVPATALRPGESYTWQARIGREQFAGGFKVLDREQSETLARDIGEIRANAGLSEGGRQFMEAVVYEYHGLESDAARTARALR